MQKRKALIKLAVVAGVSVALIIALIYAANLQQIDHIKHSLSMGSIIALVIVINVISFLCFLVMFAAYQWIRKDFKDTVDKSP